MNDLKNFLRQHKNDGLDDCLSVLSTWLLRDACEDPDAREHIAATKALLVVQHGMSRELVREYERRCRQRHAAWLNGRIT